MIAHEKDKLDRLTYFSDAVFAIAMTLLVIEVRLPPLHVVSDQALAQALVDLLPNYIGFVVSFLVLARFWIGHHRIAGQLIATPPGLVWANLFFLLAVAFMPFPTAIMSEYTGLRTAIGFYTGWLVVLGLLNVVLVRAALGTPVAIDPAIDEPQLALQRRSAWMPVVIGALGFAAGLALPLAGLVVLTLGTPVIGWLFGRARRG